MMMIWRYSKFWTKLFLSTVCLSLSLLYERKPWRPFFLVVCIYQDQNVLVFFLFLIIIIFTDYFVLFITTQHIERHFNFTQKKQQQQKDPRALLVPPPIVDGILRLLMICSFLFSTRSSACRVWIPLPFFFELFFPLLFVTRSCALLYTIGIVI
jgi:hypothetical protein